MTRTSADVLDFGAVRKQQRTIQEMANGMKKADLAAGTIALTNEVLARMQGVSDADVTFQPVDPVANDQFAADRADVDLAWTLGHVVVHLTASAEEAAFIAAELARGVVRDRKSVV